MLLIHSPAEREVANTFALPCRPAALLEADSPTDVCAARDWAVEQGLPLLPLGEGSNSILPPRLEAAVLTISDRSVSVLDSDTRGDHIRVGAGKHWHDLVLECLNARRFGLENLALIPGSVGAAPVQNIGAYGVELASFVTSVRGVDLHTGEPVTLSRDACAFAYRDSVFKRERAGRFVICSVDLHLRRENAPNLSYPALREYLRASELPLNAERVCDAVIALRSSRLPDPHQTPNVGSFFKNPEVSVEQAEALQREYPALPQFPAADSRVKIPAAWLIESCGFKGRKKGAVAVSARHALVLVNDGGGCQDDVLAIAREISEEVRARFAITLEPEPRIYQSDGRLARFVEEAAGTGHG